MTMVVSFASSENLLSNQKPNLENTSKRKRETKTCEKLGPQIGRNITLAYVDLSYFLITRARGSFWRKKQN